MINLDILDFRDEFYLQVFRRLQIVVTLCDNKKFQSGVPLEKAALVDFLLCNPPVMQRLLIKFGRPEPALNLENLLYRDNIEYGSAQEEKDFAMTCILLISKSYMTFSKKDGVVYLLPAAKDLFTENQLANRWKAEINSL
ncbi:hypothetical protein, partial [Caballeronia sp. 15711]|uniref:hypothetical protein n=1 Tax=Caballeronia sp. 15711 TaxID=3391029 RepID=UPI0039E56020